MQRTHPSPSCVSNGAFLVAAALLAGSSARAQWTVIPLSGGQALGIGGGVTVGSDAGNAVLWNGTSPTPVVLGSGSAIATDGLQQVGNTADSHPALWTGSAGSFVDLTPPGWDYPVGVTGVDGGIQVGWVAHSLLIYAGYWTGTAASWTGLDSLCGSTSSSKALAVHGGVVVGSRNWSFDPHAHMWVLSPPACVDLHPVSLPLGSQSTALAVHGGRQAGWTSTTGTAPHHAALWSGTPETWIDLHPAGAQSSQVKGLSLAYQVGSVRIGGFDHASVWSGTADSWVDLHAFVPGATQSRATGVWTDASGVTFISGSVEPGGAVLWTRSDAGTVFCSGDGSATACPCGNVGSAGNGCANSVFAAGANLVATGTASISADTVTLLGSNMPNSSALFFQGTTQANGGNGTVFGDGLRCAGGTVQRLGTKMNTGNQSRYPVLGDPLISVRGMITVPGMRTYQVWYRNAAAFCTADTFNVSNGVAIQWTP